jgi:hypothetical protein
MTLARCLELGVTVRYGHVRELRYVVECRGIPQGGAEDATGAIEAAWMVAKEAALIAETELHLI